VALLKDDLEKVFPKVGNPGPTALPSRPVFYLAGPGFVPLFGFYVETDRPDAADSIEKALIQMGRLRAVKAIANRKSPLGGKVKIVPARFRLATPPCDADGNIIPVELSTPSLNAAKTAYLFDQQEFFWLEIENSSTSDLYLTMLAIGTDGGVKILVPRQIVGEQDHGFKLAAGQKRIVPSDTCREGVARTTGPAGIETFKVIATTLPVKRQLFEFLEMKGLGRGERASLTTFGEWTTAEVSFEISAVVRQ
jgi:hypothetical protein